MIRQFFLSRRNDETTHHILRFVYSIYRTYDETEYSSSDWVIHFVIVDQQTAFKSTLKMQSLLRNARGRFNDTLIYDKNISKSKTMLQIPCLRLFSSDSNRDFFFFECNINQIRTSEPLMIQTEVFFSTKTFFYFFNLF